MNKVIKASLAACIMSLLTAGSFAATTKSGVATFLKGDKGTTTLTCPWKPNTSCYTIENDGTITIYTELRVFTGTVLEEHGSGTIDDPWGAEVVLDNDADCPDCE